MYRRIDELGRIVLPKEIREDMNINTGDKLNIVKDNNKIVLYKEETLEELLEQRDALDKRIKELSNKD